MVKDSNNFEQLDDIQKLLAICEMLDDIQVNDIDEQNEIEQLKKDEQYQKNLKIYINNNLNDIYQKYISIKKLYDTIK